MKWDQIADIYTDYIHMMAKKFKVLHYIMLWTCAVPIVGLAVLAVIVSLPVHFPIYCVGYLWFPEDLKKYRAKLAERRASHQVESAMRYYKKEIEEPTV